MASLLSQWFQLFPKDTTPQTQSTQTRKKCKLAFLVFGCATKEKYSNQLNACQETWGKEAESLGFPVYYVVGKVPENFEVNGHLLSFPNVGEDLPSVNYKHWWGLHRILNECVDPEFLCICGSDTFPLLKNLTTLIDKFNNNSDIYIGGRGGDRWVGESVPFVNGGPCIIISRNVCNKIIPYCKHMPELWKHYIQIIYKDANNELSWSCDVTLAALLFCLDIHPIFIDGFYYHKNVCDCEDCRKQLPVRNTYAYHFIQPNEMYNLHKKHSISANST